MVKFTTMSTRTELIRLVIYVINLKMRGLEMGSLMKFIGCSDIVLIIRKQYKNNHIIKIYFI